MLGHGLYLKEPLNSRRPIAGALKKKYPKQPWDISKKSLNSNRLKI